VIDKKNSKKLNELFGSSPNKEKLYLSYSRTSDFDRNGPQCLIKRTFVDNEGAKIGSITDDLLYNRLVDKTYFKKRYYQYDSKKPTATTLKLCNYITTNYAKKPNLNQILQIIKDNKFWSGTTDDEKLIAKFNTKQFWDYITAFYESKTKTIVSSSEYYLAKDLVDTIMTHKYSSYIFDSDQQNIYQFPIKFKLKHFVFRGILDILRIDHKNKEVTMIDLKTGKEDAENFMISFLKWRYDLQSAVYSLAFKSICKELNLKDYKLKPFEFLYISRYQKIPLLYEVSDTWHKASLYGFSTSKKYYRGLYELIDIIKWHWDNKVFDSTKEIYESNGRISIDDSFIKLK